ncbi:replication initiator protein A [Pseudosulfitobacter sp. DSM 107133]|uniref:replication initiator protein A n=1 Tax=Pseudosulfitobacter sp. DSM 107133 TaxID=2883100 RepID=UPI000DF22DD2|nr:replication initiator protein A [Pseudosulfitobacter sp. DSM 107133]UOA30212.1 plasmid replication protein RepA-XVI [Pseudosulfitobacter sp. DSM 107133]
MSITTEQWREIYSELAIELGEHTCASWIEPLTCAESMPANELHLQAPTSFIADYVEKNYGRAIIDAAEAVLSISIERLVFTVSPASAKSSAPSKHLRNVPKHDAQIDMFVPNLVELPIKDDIHLMGVSPFVLQPRGETRMELVYNNVSDVDIRIEANEKYGLLRATDYDFVLFMQSWLTHFANEYRDQVQRWQKTKRGAEPPKPPRRFAPDVNDILRFARVYDNAGKTQREQVEGMFNRLANNHVKISRSGRKRRRWGSFSFVDGWEVIEENTTGNIQKVQVGIPQWIYEGIVEAPTPTILTYSRDYFLLKQPVLRFLYRLCRVCDKKLDNQNSYDIPLSDVYHRSGSRRAQKRFNQELREYVSGFENGHFFDWTVAIEGAREQATLIIKRVPLLVETSS